MRRKTVILSIAALLTGLSAGCGEQTAPISDANAIPSGCELITKPYDEREDFTDSAAQRGGHTGIVPIVLTRKGPSASDKAPDDLLGMDPLGSTVTEGGQEEVFFGTSDTDVSSYQGFVETGGAIFTMWPVEDSTTLVTAMLAEVPDAVLPVRVAEDDGLLVWEDPVDGQKNRAHRVVWAQDGFNYEVRAVRNSDEIVNAARQAMC